MLTRPGNRPKGQEMIPGDAFDVLDLNRGNYFFDLRKSVFAFVVLWA